MKVPPLFLFAGVAFAQWSDFSAFTGSANLYNAMNSKPAIRSGTAAPSASCTVGKDLYIRTTNGVLYTCPSTNTWIPMSILTAAGQGIAITGSTIAVDDAVIPLYYTGSGAPGIGCQVGRDYYVDTTNFLLYFCRATNIWALAGGNGFVKFSGPATSVKTFTLPNSSETLLYSGGALGTPASGTLTNATGLPATTGITGTLPVGNGGTNLTAATDDQAMIGNGTTWESKAIPNCTDTGGNHLNYTASTNSLSCGTSSSGGSSLGFPVTMNPGGTGVAGSTTTFAGPNIQTFGAEASRNFILPSDCTARDLRVRTSGTQGSGGSLVVTLRNVTTTTDSSLSVTIAANAAPALFSDTSNTASVTAGDLMVLKLVNNHSATSAGISGISFRCN